MLYGQQNKQELKMKEKTTNQKPDQEIGAISAVYEALNNLDSQAQQRVIEYVTKKLNLSSVCSIASPRTEIDEQIEPTPREKVAHHSSEDEPGATDGELDGISSVAQKWIQRSGITPNKLSLIFSLGVDEIDLVAKSVPGKSVRARMLNVVLLKGIAAYLSSGVPRVNLAQLKDACTHYNAYDENNFYKHIKGFAVHLSGSKETGYSLTARGLTDATEIIKEMIEAKKA